LSCGADKTRRKGFSRFLGSFYNAQHVRRVALALFMLILCLCPERYHWKLIPGYAAAFRRLGIEFFCVGEGLPFDAPTQEILKLCPGRPTWIFHFESGLPLLPQGLEKCEIPTLCFHVDTYAFTRRRVRWSYLFDHVVVFHPGYDSIFSEAGHPGAFLLPHAVQREFFDGPELPREFEIGWVGQVSGPNYRSRGELLPRLAAMFRTNNWARPHTLEEVAGVYQRSRIVVNIGRDDFPQDANQRVFEAMASGALLLTSLPTELTELGFQEGTHFVAYRRESEIVSLVHKYLQDERNRARIASAGRAKVLDEHTYDQRAVQLLAHLKQAGGERLAPARFWPESRARLMALDFYAAHGLLLCASAQFRRIAGCGFRETIEGGALLTRAWLRNRRWL
jgi:glycosyltransferase involved in cell wall biosynthesis